MTKYQIGEFYIPERMMSAINRYVQEHILPGNFLQAVICNNLHLSVRFADNENLKNIPAFVSYFYNEVTSDCWGSKEKMENWIMKRENK